MRFTQLYEELLMCAFGHLHAEYSKRVREFPSPSLWNKKKALCWDHVRPSVCQSDAVSATKWSSEMFMKVIPDDGSKRAETCSILIVY